MKDEAKPFELTLPRTRSSCAVFSSPHSGRVYDARFVSRSRLGALSLRASEDAFVDMLFEAAPACGAPLLAATAPRAFVDLNRAPNELDPAVIEGARAQGLNPRIAAGLGVIPRVVSEEIEIYDGKISLAEATDRLRRFHHPYHEALADLLRGARMAHGQAILFDCHSMPRDALRAAPRANGRCLDIVLGDRFGASASRRVVDLVHAAFTEAGFAVSRNTPFAGGYITQTYGRPTRMIHAVQIEINRGLYLDEKRLEPGAGFEALSRTLAPVVANLCAISEEYSRLAAE